ncbi:MAG TPA: MlaD family protein [Thermoleophilaceae bacterium]|jgi:virulence factor Mce-like protein
MARGKQTGRRGPGIPNFRAGVIAIVLLSLLTYFGFTKTNPFSHPYELHAVFDNVNNLKPNSPVRIAGVDVGKVKKVEALSEGDGAAKVTMEIKKKGLPIHQDATVKVRTRIFLEGNFFVDLSPGSPSAPTMKDGGTIPIQHTAAPVQFGQLLTALQSDTRDDLKVFLREYSKGLSGKGAAGFNQSIRYWEPAYKNSALANDATLGEQPHSDLQRVLKGQQRTFAALDADEGALQGLVTNFNTTAAAFASQDQALSASVPALRDTLRAAQPALASLNDALPSLRAFSIDALPGARSSGPTLDAALPFIRQVRLLMRPSELRGLASELREQTPNLVSLNRTSVPVLTQARALSACTNNVLIPFIRSPIPNVVGPDGANGNTNQLVRYQIQRSFPGLSGESRLSEGNNQDFHTSAIPLPKAVQPAPAANIDQPPPRRPDVPCETQDPPNLNAPSAPTNQFASHIPRSWGVTHFKAKPLERAYTLLNELQTKRDKMVKRYLLRKKREREGR